MKSKLEENKINKTIDTVMDIFKKENLSYSEAESIIRGLRKTISTSAKIRD